MVKINVIEPSFTLFCAFSAPFKRYQEIVLIYQDIYFYSPQRSAEDKIERRHSNLLQLSSKLKKSSKSEKIFTVKIHSLEPIHEPFHGPYISGMPEQCSPPSPQAVLNFFLEGFLVLIHSDVPVPWEYLEINKLNLCQTCQLIFTLSWVINKGWHRLGFVVYGHKFWFSLNQLRSVIGTRFDVITH